MKVVLLQDVKKMGKKGDVIEVSDGYGRNVLIRKGLGVEGTRQNLNTAAQRQEASEALQAQYKFKLDKKNIRLESPIKATGEYDVEVWVHQNVTSTVHVSVIPE